MEEELQALEHNQIWELVPLPPGKSAIGCRWVYVVKVNADGSLARLKARLINTGRIFLIVYVDDIVIIGDDSEGFKSLKSHLQQRFQTTDLGKLNYFLGVEVAQSRKGISLSHWKYTLDLLTEIGMLGCRPLDNLMDPNVKLVAEEADVLDDPEKYSRLVGKLNYLTFTRPDIAFPISVVSQFLSSPRTPHWDVVIRILRYLKKAPRCGLVYASHEHGRVEGFLDENWAGLLVDRRSTIGYCVYVGGNLV
ncbi:uncharacterized mitochondrial protein AtMg00810-like [Telopea speciosissima]|uniref:uncharacterized mitochondrial protein AtMg00810-like n=1 Tax=Telopea speciosissima TaxID=54955 RepID=UPI001CC5A66B|nr:uncharacterized mitochondrial protein AtMg00810-like [Telopea speciosissima]